MRLIDADALLEKAVEADRMGAMLVVGKGHIMNAPTVMDIAVVELLVEVSRLTAERDAALRRADAAVREIESMLMDTCDTSRCINMKCHLDQASCNPIWRGPEPGGEGSK